MSKQFLKITDTDDQEYLINISNILSIEGDGNECHILLAEDGRMDYGDVGGNYKRLIIAKTSLKAIMWVLGDAVADAG